MTTHQPSPTEPSPTKPTTPSPSRRAKVILVLLSLAMGLVAAEAIASNVRGHAFPFLNVFIADATYGVRLDAGAETATRSRDGRISEVRINAQGFRGGDWTPAENPKPVAGRVLLLGDSQMFGYGVDEGDSQIGRLPAALGPGHEVLDAAVPTWGPPEYARIVDELAPTYRPAVVVFVANVANDWFEAKVDNARRTTARDGWAAYNLVGTSEPTEFPGRRFVFGRSHLVLGVREIMAFGSRQAAPPQATSAAARLADQLKYLIRTDAPHRSRITRHLLAARDACERWGCRVVTVTLPLDVQVHASEWAKYSDAPIDLGRVRALAGIYLEEARTHGVPALDLFEPLAAASPGAFLPDDYHLSPAGHRAVAEAIAPLIAEATSR